MNLWQLLIHGEGAGAATSTPEAPAPTFMVDTDAIDPAVFGLASYTDTLAPEGRISRKLAIQAGAVKRSRDLIPGVLGTLPPKLFDSSKREVPWSLFEQPERDKPRSVTLTKTFENMFFEGVAWWYVTELSWNGYPAFVRQLDPRCVAVDLGGRVRVTQHAGVPEYPANERLIRFDSPNDPLLSAAAAAIRVYLYVQKMTRRNVDGTPPVDYFTPAEGADPAEDADVTAILDAWHAARQKSATGYVPAALKYNTAGWSPEQLQLTEIRRDAALEIALHAGVDPEELGISTTSRVYANQFDRRKNYTDFTLGAYLSAVQDRLRMNDVTPRGYTPKLDLSEFQRSDDKTRFEAYTAGLAAGAYSDKNEVRDAEGKPHMELPKAPPAPPAPPAAPDQLRAVPNPQEGGDRRAV